MLMKITPLKCTYNQPKYSLAFPLKDEKCTFSSEICRYIFLHPPTVHPSSKNQRVVVGQHETMYQGGSQGGQTFPRTGIVRAMIFLLAEMKKLVEKRQKKQLLVCTVLSSFRTSSEWRNMLSIQM